MSETVSIFERALVMEPGRRMELAFALLHSLEPDISATRKEAIARESEDRIDAFERGDIEALSHEESMRLLGLS